MKKIVSFAKRHPCIAAGTVVGLLVCSVIGSLTSDPAPAAAPAPRITVTAEPSPTKTTKPKPTGRELFAERSKKCADSPYGESVDGMLWNESVGYYDDVPDAVFGVVGINPDARQSAPVIQMRRCVFGEVTGEPELVYSAFRSGQAGRYGDWELVIIPTDTNPGNWVAAVKYVG